MEGDEGDVTLNFFFMMVPRIKTWCMFMHILPVTLLIMVLGMLKSSKID